MNTSFFSDREIADSQEFLAHGYIIRAAESLDDLDRIRALVASSAGKYLGLEDTAPAELLNGIHKHVTPAALNELRLHTLGAINAADWVRPAYFRLARQLLETIVGNELAMQLRLNISIQLPDDSSSLLPIHADTWAGDSPFEIVVWIPLVDCYKTKSMFILPRGPSSEPGNLFSRPEISDSEALFRAVENELTWLDVNYGQVLVFNQNLPHGNRINREPETRWSLNCRFKGVFTPYSDKRLGEFFEPITLRAASRIGVDYRDADIPTNAERGAR